MFRKQYAGHSDRGAAAVEMALVLPLLLLMLFGLVDFGRAYNAQMQLTQAAREAVRVMALRGADPLAPADAQARVDVATSGLLSPSTAPFPKPTASFPLTCAAGNSTANVKVTVSFSFQFITPLGPMARLIGASTLPDAGTLKTLSADGVMRCSG